MDVETQGSLGFPGGKRLLLSCGFRRADDTFARLLGTGGQINITAPYHPRAGRHVPGRRAGQAAAQLPGGRRRSSRSPPAIRHIQAVLRGAGRTPGAGPGHLAAHRAGPARPARERRRPSGLRPARPRPPRRRPAGTAQASTAARPGDMSQDAEIRAALAAERAATLDRMAALRRDFDGIVDSSALVATDDEHDPEGATIAFERAQLAALLDQARAAPGRPGPGARPAGPGQLRPLRAVRPADRRRPGWPPAPPPAPASAARPRR